MENPLHFALDTMTIGHGIVELSIILKACERRERGMTKQLLDDKYDEQMYLLGAEMAKDEINVLAVTESYLLYEFSFIDGNKMKKWAKRIAPVMDSIEETYAGILYLVENEREALGQ